MFVVIGHNVFRIVPNEVVILCIAGLISARVRNDSIAALGFRRPAAWTWILQVALAAATLRIILGEFVIDPLAELYWPPAAAPEAAREITGNLGNAALALVIVWGFAAFGEEIAYRGYLLTRAAETGGSSAAAFWIAMVVVAILFGFGHAYKGPAGIVDSGIAGLILGAAYLVSGRNLWACILAHGFIDSYAVVMAYLGVL